MEEKIVFSMQEFIDEIERIKKEEPERYRQIAAACIGFKIGWTAREKGITIKELD